MFEWPWSAGVVSFLAPLTAFAGTFGLIYWMLQSGRVRLALDHPNARSLHESPVPRTGGLAIMCVTLPVAALVIRDHAAVLWCAAGLAAVSFIDDWRGLAIGWRFLAHFLAATIFAVLGFSGVPIYALGLIVLAIVWMTNLYNFMDGSDGLAGGMALIGFSVYGLTSWLAGDWNLSLVTLCVAASALAFLFFNFHPARVFLGDMGSIPFGFLAAAIGLVGWRNKLWPLWFPLLVFSPFIVDASVTLIKRTLRGEKVWQAHKSHYYQRLVQMGWGHRKTAVAEYVLMLALGASAVWGVMEPIYYQVILLGGWVGIYIVLILLIDNRWEIYCSENIK